VFLLKFMIIGKIWMMQTSEMICVCVCVSVSAFANYGFNIHVYRRQAQSNQNLPIGMRYRAMQKSFKENVAVFRLGSCVSLVGSSKNLWSCTYNEGVLHS
jgi:hypothetical protein